MADTINWKPMSQKPTGKFLNPPNAAKYKVMLAGGQYPVGMDYFPDAREDRTHWCFRTEIPGPMNLVKPRKTTAKKAVKKVAKKATKKAAAKRGSISRSIR